MIKGIIGMVLICVSAMLIPLLLARIFFGKNYIEWLADLVLDRYMESKDG